MRLHSAQQYLTVVYATGSRGENIDQPVIRQQSQADFAWTLCQSRDLPGKHNKLSNTAVQRKGAWLRCEKVTNDIFKRCYRPSARHHRLHQLLKDRQINLLLR